MPGGEAEADEIELGEKRHSRDWRWRNLRILLAEDNIVNQKVVVGIIGKLGARVDTVSNGRAAVERLATDNYDLVLMDCLMPEMDGYEATRLIRGKDSTAINPKIPIIALTANAMQGEREKCLSIGMNDYITKPIIPRNLMEAIMLHCAKTGDDLNSQIV